MKFLCRVIGHTGCPTSSENCCFCHSCGRPREDLTLCARAVTAIREWFRDAWAGRKNYDNRHVWSVVLYVVLFAALRSLF